MNKLASIKKIRIILVAVYVVFVLAITAWAVQAYHGTKHALADLDSQKLSLSRLNTEIKTTRDSIDRMKTEQGEFRKLLFNDRDVPAFLDSLSHSAAKASVHIVDMKTQRFNQIIVPKEMAAANAVEQRRGNVYDESDNKVDPSVEFQDMLTLAAMPINVKIHGTFASIVHFLNSIENERQLLTVSNVEITRNITDYPQLDCEFNLNIYSLKQLKDIHT